MKNSIKWFAAFTAVFAVFAASVFWGTWSLNVVPVMPDAWLTHPDDYLARHVNALLSSGCFTPTSLLHFLPPYLTHEFLCVFAIYMAALGVAYYGIGRGFTHPAAYGAGLLLAFCGYWFTLFSAGHMGWFYWMIYGVFAFGLVDRVIEKGELRHWLLLGAVVSWASFTQQDLWLLFTVFTACYFVYRAILARKFPWKGVLVSAVVFVLIGIPNFKSTIQNTLKGRIDQIERGENVTQKDDAGVDDAAKRWEFVTNWSMPPEDTLEFFISRVHGDTSCPFILSMNGRTKGVEPYTGALGRSLNAKQGNYRQHSLYVGFVTIVFALLGVIFGIKDRDVRFFAAAALLTYLLSLGRYFEPLYRIVFMLPFGDLIRCPVKWHHLTELSLCILAGYGINAMYLRFKDVRVRSVIVGAVILGVALLVMNARLYLAPVDVSAARARNLKSDLTIMSRQEFANPQVQEMVKQGLIRSVAQFYANPNAYVVQYLHPYDNDTSKPTPLSMTMLVVSLLTTLAVSVYGIKKL